MITDHSHAEMLGPLRRDVQQLTGLAPGCRLDLVCAMCTNPWIWDQFTGSASTDARPPRREKATLGPYYNHVKIADIAALALRHEGLIRTYWRHCEEEAKARREAPRDPPTVDPTDYRMNLDLFIERMRSCVK